MFVFWTAVDNWIEDVAACLIADGLEKNTSLKILDLSCESPLNFIPVSFGCYLMACLIFI